MKRKVLSAAFAFLLSISLFVRANPYNPQQVPATAQWILHFDFDALKESGVGREIVNIQKANATLNFVIQRMDTLHSILLFGSRFSSDNAVLLINGDFSITANQVGIELTGGKGFGVYYSADLLILGHDKQENAAAVRVLDRKAPALPKDSPLAAPGLKNAVFIAAAIKPGNISMLQKEPWHVLIDNMNDASISVVATQNEIQAQTRLTADSDDVASNVKIALKGFQAILKLKPADPDPLIKTVVKLFADATIDSNQKKIIVDMKVPLKEVIGVITKTLSKELDHTTQPSK